MTIAFIITLVVALVLGIAFYFQLKASHKQADEQQQLLADYQQRVDEQQKLLDDYRALEKNFENVGQGYEQALLAFDKMEEDSQKAKTVNDALQRQLEQVQQQHATLSENVRQRESARQKLMGELQQALQATADSKLAAIVGRLLDIDEVAPDQAPFERTDNVMVAQVAQEAVTVSGIDKVSYLEFHLNVAEDAAYTMLSTNLPKAVRSLTHLLDNARKFTTEGSVTLSVSIDMDKMQAIYTVEDTGSGIPADDAERIFEPYVRLNQFFDGEGVGLTVARNLAQRLGGDITLDTSFAGPGSRFRLVLPI
jgi:signal transduction histidine kinase